MPRALLQRTTQQIALVHNNIASLPKEFFEKPAAARLWLNGNLISELPDALAPSTLLEYVDFSYTNLQSLPT